MRNIHSKSIRQNTILIANITEILQPLNFIVTIVHKSLIKQWHLWSLLHNNITIESHKRKSVIRFLTISFEALDRSEWCCIIQVKPLIKIIVLQVKQEKNNIHEDIVWVWIYHTFYLLYNYLNPVCCVAGYIPFYSFEFYARNILICTIWKGTTSAFANVNFKRRNNNGVFGLSQNVIWQFWQCFIQCSYVVTLQRAEYTCRPHIHVGQPEMAGLHTSNSKIS